MMTILDYLKSQYLPPQAQFTAPANVFAALNQLNDQAPAPAATPPVPGTATAPAVSAPVSTAAPKALQPIPQMTMAPDAGISPVAAPHRSIMDMLSDPGIARALLAGGSALLEAGGPSARPVGLGQGLGASMNQSVQAYDTQRAIDAQKAQQKQAMAANQWRTMTPDEAKKVVPGGIAPGYAAQVNGNGEVRVVGQDVIRQGTDANGFPVLQDIRKPMGGAAAPGKTSSAIDSTVDLIGKYQVPLQTALARVPAALRLSVQQRLSEKYPDYQAENFTMYNKGYRDFGTGQQGNTVRSMNVGISHLNTLGDLADALDNGDVQLLNRVKNAWKTQIGSAAPTNFDAAKNVVAQELVKAITGYPGAASDREAAADEIKNASSPAQLKGVIDTYQKLLAGQLQGLKGQYEHATGRNDFEDAMKLSPEVLQKLDGGSVPTPSFLDPAVKNMSNADLLQQLGIGGPRG